MAAEVVKIEPWPFAASRLEPGWRIGNLVFTAGQVAVADDPHETVGVGDFDAQAEQVFENLGNVLAAAGSSLDRVVKLTTYLTDMANLAPLVELRRRYLTSPYPASTTVEVGSLSSPELMLEIEAIAATTEAHDAGGGEAMASGQPKVIKIEPWAYAANRIEPGWRIGDLVYTSGQVAVGDDASDIVGAGDFDAQAEQVMKNLKKILEAGGSSLDDVLKVTIYLTDMANLPKIVELRGRWFSPPYPASTMVEVSALAAPEFMLEIEAVAARSA